MSEIFSELLSMFAAIDEHLLLVLNGFHTPFADRLMWMVSDKWLWVPMYVLLAIIIVCRYPAARYIPAFCFIAVCIVATDQTCASVIRPALERMRPSSTDNPISTLVHIVNGYRGGRYGFPSCHAANSFALAVFISCLFRQRCVTVMMLAWAVVVSYSRIYLGVHYPGDILGGMTVGGVYAMLCYRAYILLSTWIENFRALSVVPLWLKPLTGNRPGR